MSKLSRTYLAYTFVIMLLCWGTCLICSFNGIGLGDNRLLYIPYILGGWSPTIASFMALRSSMGFREWMRGIFDFRHGAAAYIMTVALCAVFIVPQCIISGYEKGAPLFAVIFMIPMMLLGGGLEEAGWRYILQPELEKNYPFALSTVIVALIWWLWHLPLFHIMGVSQYGQNYLAFGLNVLGLSFALAAVRRTAGGVWLCVLLHCITNSLSGVFLVRDNILGSAVSAAALILCSLFLIELNDRKKIFN